MHLSLLRRLVVVVLGISMIGACSSQDGDALRTSSSDTPHASASSETLHGDDADEAPAPEASWKPVAQGFATDFADTHGGQQAWAKRLARWVTPELAAQLSTVDLRRLADGTVQEVRSESVGHGLAQVVVRYAAGGPQPILVTVEIFPPDRWRVTRYEPYNG